MDTPKIDHERERAMESLSQGEERDAIERAGPRAAVVYASISARGIEELNRPLISLIGSGVAAGIILMMSVIAEGLFLWALPDFPGVAAIGDIGYTFGFILVIMGRMQLFTENTITPVLPLLANPTTSAFVRTGRLWTVVFVANLVGTFIAAVMLVHGGIVTPDQLESLMVVAAKVEKNTAMETLRYGIVAGFLIAALVWCMPTSRGSEFWLILFVTYVIALGNFTHVIAGSGEGFMLLLDGRVTLEWVAFGLVIPALIGNMIGGTVLFAVLAYVQVMDELVETDESRRRHEVKPPRPTGPFGRRKVDRDE